MFGIWQQIDAKRDAILFNRDFAFFVLERT